LRALKGNPALEVELPADTEQMLRRFAAEHDELRDTVGLLRDAANNLAAGAGPAALASLTRAHAFLIQRILPHEHAEETELYPALARPLGSGEATATMSRTHAEIQRLADRISTHVALAKAGNAIQPDQVDDLLACLYGLYTLLRLHFLQEEENYFTLADDELDTPGSATTSVGT
jgi:hemerythrin-like domain-containing protein